MTVEVLDIFVTKPCPVCSVMPECTTASGWKRVMCPKCGFGTALAHGTINDAIGQYNKVVEAYDQKKV